MKQWIALGCLIFLFSGFTSLAGETRFSGLQLTEDNRLLFVSESKAPVYGSFRTLFSSDLTSSKMTQLTFFPESVSLIDGNRRVQVQNRYGVFRSDQELTVISTMKNFPSFAEGDEIQSGKLLKAGASPDGRYVLYLRPNSFAFADLVLFETAQGTEVTITVDIELSFDTPAVSWSPDSRYFIYAKKNALYYFSLDQYRSGRLLSEQHRMVGPGLISSVVWSARNNLYYIRGSLLYQIVSSEFFARSLYSDLLKIGQIAGKVPFDFDPNFDSFYISPDGKKLLFNKDGSNLFLYFLKEDDFLSTGDIQSLPYLFLPRNTRIKELVWSARDLITILAGSFQGGAESGSVFRIDLTDQKTPLYFTRTSDKGVKGLSLSENEQKVALVMENSVVVKDYSSWRNLATYAHTAPMHLLWRDHNELLVAGSRVIELIHTDSGSRHIVTLSQPGDFGIDKSGAVFSSGQGTANNTRPAENEVVEYYFHSVGEGWKKGTTPEPLPVKVVTDQYRVYLEQIASGSYRNMVMVRSLEEFGTSTLFPYPRRQYAPFPERDEKVDFDHFTHGSRIRRREVSLVFNAIDTLEGLTDILHILSEYDIRSTFFINGEFIRRNPDAVRELAASGHEIGSLFYLYFDMTDSRYKVDEDFIKRGLAINEDDYFEVTGKELSLLWHAPYYFVNSDIIRASKAMNYTYIGRDIDPLDWVPFGTHSRMPYLSSREIIERIMEQKKPGSIIPVRIGIGESSRKDYLFHNLDLLINALVSRGFELVTVSTLMEHAK